MDITITIRGEKHTFENVESFDKTADPQGHKIFLIDGEEVLKDKFGASSFSVTGFGQKTDLKSSPHPTATHPTTENTPLKSTLPDFNDQRTRSYQTFIYDLYHIMSDEQAYNVLASFTTYTNFPSVNTTAEFGAKGLQYLCSPTTDNNLTWSYYHRIFVPNPYDVETPGIPDVADDTELHDHEIDWTEAAKENQYWIEVPKLLYYVCANDVANTILGGAINVASKHDMNFTDALSSATEKWLTDAQISYIGLDKRPTPNQSEKIPTTN